MSDEFETFALYYTAFHEGEFSLAAMKEALLLDLGADGFAKALADFKAKRLEREAAGVKGTLYDELKGNKT
jgi:hypothetical protein